MAGTSMMKVRVGRAVSWAAAPLSSVQDLMSASVFLMISRTVKPEGPAHAWRTHAPACQSLPV